jgi:hypothetical protein
MVNASHCVGLSLPGMIDDPGSFSGILISANPHVGHRRTSGDFVRWLLGLNSHSFISLQIIRSPRDD